MSGFHDRKASADEFERLVIERLILNGWHSEPFGQAMLSEQSRTLLKRSKTLLRWMPDIITAKAFKNGKVTVALIDAKICGNDQPNHSVEIAALEAAEFFLKIIPVYFVFSNWKVLTPDDVKNYGWEGRFKGSGSGTPFLLFEKHAGVDFDSVFVPTP